MSKHSNHYIPSNLEPDDPGEPALLQGPSAREQDAKFCAMMGLAIANGSETMPKVTPVDPNETRVLRTVRAPTIVFTASSANTTASS